MAVRLTRYSVPMAVRLTCYSAGNEKKERKKLKSWKWAKELESGDFSWKSGEFEIFYDFCDSYIAHRHRLVKHSHIYE